MKKLLVGCLIIVVLLVLALVVTYFLLPESYEVQRETTINATPAQIYEYVGHLDKWPEWSTWTTENYPAIEYTYYETEGVGARQTWTQADGSGELTLTHASPDSGIKYDMVFDEAFKASGEILFEQGDGGTLVKWRNYGDLEGPGRLMGPMMDSMMGPDFESGLAKLKGMLETK